VKPLLLTLKLLEKNIKIGRTESVWPDGIPGDILKLGSEAMTTRNIIKQCCHFK
jgi:hypothetical protein